MVENPRQNIFHRRSYGDNIHHILGLDKRYKEHHENWLYPENSSTLFYWLLLIPTPASILTSHSLSNGLYFFGSFCVYLASCSMDLALQNILFLYCLIMVISVCLRSDVLSWPFSKSIRQKQLFTFIII